MYNALLLLHSLLRWAIIVLALIAIFRSYAGMKGNKPFTTGEKKTGLFLMICAHTTLLIGLYQWIVGPLGLKIIQNVGMSEVMKNNSYRFFAVEHFTGMLIAIILITIGRGASKKNISDLAKHKKTFWFFLIALIIILASIPWPFRTGISRPWL